MRELLSHVSWRDGLEVFLLTIVIYKLLQFIRRTRALQVLKGLLVLFVASLLARLFQLHTFETIFMSMWVLAGIAILIIFQPELRRALAKIGENPLPGPHARRERYPDEVVKAVNFLARRKTGALIVVERGVGLGPYAETGVRLDAHVSSELLCTIFTSGSALHDGAVVIQAPRITAASCVLPLSEDPAVGTGMGTRHRAALGLAVETDAFVIVVSEDDGTVRAAVDGRLTGDLDGESLGRMLREKCFPRHRRFFWQAGLRRSAREKSVAE